MRLIDIVNKLPDKPWDWFFLSLNQNITFDHVLKHPSTLELGWIKF
jgi:hypothetical protein